jgi:hypothetical protein
MSGFAFLAPSGCKEAESPFWQSPHNLTWNELMKTLIRLTAALALAGTAYTAHAQVPRAAPDSNVPRGFAFCTSEWGTCDTQNGNLLVSYGFNGKFVYKRMSGKFKCTTAVFGRDPYPGKIKVCAKEATF